MKKETVAVVIFSVGLMIVAGACTTPRDNQTPQKKQERKSGCGCQSSENILDLRATPQDMGDELVDPTAKL